MESNAGGGGERDKEMGWRREGEKEWMKEVDRRWTSGLAVASEVKFMDSLLTMRC